jgi:hypothetical protein
MDRHAILGQTKHVGHWRMIAVGVIMCVFLQYSETSRWRGIAAAAIKGNGGADLVATAKDRKCLVGQVHAHPHRSVGNVIVVPDKVAIMHGLSDVQQAAHNLVPSTGQREFGVVSRRIPDIRRDDGRYVTQRAISGSSDSPLGVDTDLSQALGTAVREATRISQEDGCRVAIDVELAKHKPIPMRLYLKILELRVFVPNLGGSNASENFFVQLQNTAHHANASNNAVRKTKLQILISNRLNRNYATIV